MNTHPTDTTIQNYVLAESEEETVLNIHINQCGLCQARVSFYRQLFAELGSQQKPSLDFDLGETVLGMLPAPAPKTSQKPLFILLIIPLLLALTAVIYILLPAQLFSWLSRVESPVIGIVIMVIAVLLIPLLAEMRREYKRVMRLIDSPSFMQH